MYVNFLSRMTLIVGEEKKSNKPNDENTVPVLKEDLYYAIKVRISLTFLFQEGVTSVTYFRHPTGYIWFNFWLFFPRKWEQAYVVKNTLNAPLFCMQSQNNKWKYEEINWSSILNYN